MPKPPKRVMPSVEGINAPRASNKVVFVKPALTEEEKKLVSQTQELKPEPRLLPNSVITRVNKKPSPVKAVVVTLIVLLILAGLGYELYNWYFVGSSKPVDINTPAAVQAPPATKLEPTISSSTPFELAGGSIASSTTSSGTSTSSPTSTPPTKKTLSLKINAISTGFLNVRAGPSSSSALVAKVHPGEVYTYTQVKNGWYLITLPSGQTGWVSGQYVTVQ